jgi:hypothetical protein
MWSVCQGARILYTEEQTATRTDIQTGMTMLIVAFRYFFFFAKHLISGKFIIMYEQPTMGPVPNHMLSVHYHTPYFFNKIHTSL